MPNQNECDHVVGLDNGPTWVRQSMLGEIKSNTLIKFDKCRQCGAKIDWEAIKEACDEH